MGFHQALGAHFDLPNSGVGKIVNRDCAIKEGWKAFAGSTASTDFKFKSIFSISEIIIIRQLIDESVRLVKGVVDVFGELGS